MASRRIRNDALKEGLVQSEARPRHPILRRGMPHETVDRCVGAICLHGVRAYGGPGASRAAGTRRGIAFRRRIEDCCCFTHASRHRHDLRRRRSLSRRDAGGRHESGAVGRARGQSEKGCGIGCRFPPRALWTARSRTRDRGGTKRFAPLTVALPSDVTFAQRTKLVGLATYRAAFFRALRSTMGDPGNAGCEHVHQNATWMLPAGRWLTIAGTPPICGPFPASHRRPRAVIRDFCERSPLAPGARGRR